MELNADNTNRLGLLLGFISFWLAAPEILGEKRLLDAEKRLEQAIALLLPLAIFAYMLWDAYEYAKIGNEYSRAYSETGRSKTGLWELGLSSFNSGLLLPPLILLATGLFMSIRFLVRYIFRRTHRAESIPFRFFELLLSATKILVYALIVICVLLLLIGIILAGSPSVELVSKFWDNMRAPLFLTPLAYAIIIFGPRILRRLADDSLARQRFLWIGAILFVLSFVLQFVATFMK
jgi:lipid-A-disaccharide synthase-like uncharacterized protein